MGIQGALALQKVLAGRLPARHAGPAATTVALAGLAKVGDHRVKKQSWFALRAGLAKTLYD